MPDPSLLALMMIACATAACAVILYHIYGVLEEIWLTLRAIERRNQKPWD